MIGHAIDPELESPRNAKLASGTSHASGERLSQVPSETRQIDFDCRTVPGVSAVLHEYYEADAARACGLELLRVTFLALKSTANNSSDAPKPMPAPCPKPWVRAVDCAWIEVAESVRICSWSFLIWPS